MGASKEGVPRTAIFKKSTFSKPFYPIKLSVVFAFKKFFLFVESFVGTLNAVIPDPSSPCSFDFIRLNMNCTTIMNFVLQVIAGLKPLPVLPIEFFTAGRSYPSPNCLERCCSLNS